MNIKITRRTMVEAPAHRKLNRTPLATALLLAMGLSQAVPAGAASFQLNDDVSLDLNTALRYSTAWRLNDQDSALLASADADDGNRNFDQGLISNRLDAVVDAELRYGDFGAFVRGRGWYDDVYSSTNDHDSPATANNTSVAFNEFTGATEELMGRDVELLDAFVYGDLGNVSFRLGKQVVNWGESLFVLGGSIVTSQNALDITKANIPGVEVKEILLPVGQGLIQARLTDTLSAEAYYQWEWEKHRLDPVGSYFSTSDLADDGGEQSLLLGGMPRGMDQHPSDSGQWGVALRYLSEELNDTEFGLYYVNYHDKLPQVTLDAVPGTYNLDYVEDIHHIALSAGTVIGDTNAGFEIGHKTNAPVAVLGGSGLNGILGLNYERADVTQAQVSFLHLGKASALWDSMSILGEVGINRVSGIDRSRLKNSKSAWGYTVRFTPTYYAVADGLDLNVPITFSQGVRGISSVPATFTEKKDKASIGLDFTYLSKYQFGASYVNFLNGPEDNNQSDRDLISLYIKTTF